MNKNTIITIVGAILAAAVAANDILNNGADVSAWQTWLLPAIIAALGYVVKNVSFVAPLLAVALCMPSCTVSMGVDGKPIIGADPVAIASAIQAWQARNGSKAANVVIIDSRGSVVPTIPEAVIVPEK